jgi:hypothetical protein
MPDFVISDSYRTELAGLPAWRLNSLEYTLGQDAEAAVTKAEEYSLNASTRPDLAEKLNAELMKADEAAARQLAVIQEKQRRKSMRG